MLDQSESSPPATDTAGAKLFESSKKHLAGIIGLKLSDQIRELPVTDTNCRDLVSLWRDIKAHFASTKARNRGRVFSKLFSLTCAGTDISDFICSAKNTLYRLSAIGVSTNSEMIRHFLLHLLPLNFETFKDMMIHTAEVTDKSLSVNSVIKLLQQHINDKHIQGLNSSLNTVLTAQNLSFGPTGRFKQLICANSKHNSATQNSPDRFWQLHPKLRPTKSSNAGNSDVLTSAGNFITPTPPAMTTYLLAAFRKTSTNIETILDSGVSTPMFCSQGNFKTYSDHIKAVHLADGNEITTQEIGSLELMGKNSTLELTNYLHIPTLAHNLISLSYLFKKGCQLVYTGHDKFEVQKNFKPILDGVIKNIIFVLEESVGKPMSPPLSASAVSDVSILQHRRLGHPNYSYLNKLDPSCPSSASAPCPTCILGKHHRLPFPGKIPRPDKVLDVIHSDLIGRISPSPVNGHYYCFKLTDGFSKFVHVYFLKHMPKTFGCSLEFKKMVENQKGKKIKILVNDSGGGYIDG